MAIPTDTNTVAPGIILLPPPTMPLITKDLKIERAWYLCLRQIISQIGGFSAPPLSVSDLQLLTDQDIDIATSDLQGLTSRLDSLSALTGNTDGLPGPSIQDVQDALLLAETALDYADNSTAMGAVNLATGVTGVLAANHGGTGVTASIGSGADSVLGDKGTFTPTVFGGTVVGATTYSNQAGFYTRIADRCFFNLLVQWSAATGTGQLNIGGLPFTSNAAALSFHAASIYYAGTDAAQSYMGLLQPNTSAIGINGHVASSGLTPVAVPASGNMIISGHYQL